MTAISLAVALAASRAPARGAERPALSKGSPWTGYAVVVGIAEHPDSYNYLPYSDDDALAMRAALLRDEEHWSAGDVTLLLDSQATKANIGLAVEFMGAVAGTDDVCVLYFSGHGSQRSDVAPLDEPDGLDETLFPYDGGGSIYTHIRDDELADWLALFSCDHICVIVSACHSGGLTKSSAGTRPRGWNDGFAADLVRSPKAARDTTRLGLVVLMGCDDYELGSQDGVVGHEIFTFYVVEALGQAATDADGNGFVSAEEVYAYAAPPVHRWYPDITPQIHDAHDGPLDLVVTGDGRIERPVTPREFPFGGGIAPGPGGCSPGGAGAAAPLAAFALAAALARRRRRRAALALALAAMLGAGCFGLSAPLAPYAALTPAGRMLAGAEPGAEAPGELSPEAERDPPGESPVPEKPPERDRRRFRAGARAGLVVPLTAEYASYAVAPQLGMYAAFAPGGLPYGWELGFDVIWLTGRKVDVDAEVFAVRADAVLGPVGRAGGGEIDLYAGARVLFDYVQAHWGEAIEFVPALSVGAGWRRPGASWDARVSLDAFLGSANLWGAVGISVGAAF